MHRSVLIATLAAGSLLAASEAVRYLTWAQMQPFIAGFAASGDKLPEFTKTSEFDAWIRERDFEVRGRTNRSFEDAISGLIVFGSSFTTEPRLRNEKDAVNAAGDLTAVARARIDAFIQALDNSDDERFRTVLEFLRRQRVTEDELRAFLIGILRRTAIDRASDPRTRASGLGTPLLSEFAISETLRMLKNDGRVPARIRRAAVIAAPFEFSGGPEGYDFYPPQSIQPFAILEAVIRLGLAPGGDVHLTALDLNPLALANMRAASAKARSGHYALQLPRGKAAGWNSAAVSYWSHFGEIIGSSAPPAPVPPDRQDVEMRAVAVKPQFAARVGTQEIDVVAQTVDAAGGSGFDLMVALNALSSYDRLEQSLALASIAQMMNPAGIVLVSGISGGGVPPELESLGARRVSYADANLDLEVQTYRRR